MVAPMKSWRAGAHALPWGYLTHRLLLGAPKGQSTSSGKRWHRGTTTRHRWPWTLTGRGTPQTTRNLNRRHFQSRRWRHLPHSGRVVARWPLHDDVSPLVRWEHAYLPWMLVFSPRLMFFFFLSFFFFCLRGEKPNWEQESGMKAERAGSCDWMLRAELTCHVSSRCPPWGVRGSKSDSRKRVIGRLLECSLPILVLDSWALTRMRLTTEAFFFYAFSLHLFFFTVPIR